MVGTLYKIKKKQQQQKAVILKTLLRPFVI